MTETTGVYRVLSIDGGGMRGLYTAAYLSGLARQYAAIRQTGPLDVGKGFNLITGTSTGGIIACGLAAGVPLETIAALYRSHGAEIFPAKLPSGVGPSFLRQLFARPKLNRQGAEALKVALEKSFQSETVNQVFERRGIALAIPAVEMARHRSWVFKTAHLGGRRDDDFSLVDVCLATSAAPIYRSLADVHDPKSDHRYIFADGGLWANNPVLVGLIDALYAAPPGAEIEIFSLGTSARPAGHVIQPGDTHWGLQHWKFGGEIAMLAIDAQQYAYDNMARMLTPHLTRSCMVARFPHDAAAAAAMKYLDLDETSEAGMRALETQAQADISQTLSETRHKMNKDAEKLDALFRAMPTLDAGRT